MKKWQPTIQQQKFVDALLSGQNITDSAEYANACRDTYYKHWRNNSDFQAYLELRRKQEAGAKLPKIDKALFEKAEGGDVPAMRLIYEVYGTLRTGVVINNNQPQAPEGIRPSDTIKAKLDELAARRKTKAANE